MVYPIASLQSFACLPVKIAVNLHKILHFDLDAFFCAMEEQRNPTLRGLAFAVGRRPVQRGVVAS